jgi:AraC-like DNA-binding protein
LTFYRSYVPRMPLAAFVKTFWFYEGDAAAHAKERHLPDGSMELVINLSKDVIRVYDRQDTRLFQSFRGNVISGAHTEFSVIDTDCQRLMIGVNFRPGGAFPFFKLPAGELRDTHVSLDTLWGASASDLRNQLLEVETTEERFRVLERFLLAHAVRTLAWHPAVAFALKEFQGEGEQACSQPPLVSDVIERSGLSSRRFIQVFRDQVGLTPKLFCRVRRFQEALHLIRGGQPIEWAEIALNCGYFDQAHFIHDFRAFSGLNPTAYLMQQGEHLNHVPLGDSK